MKLMILDGNSVINRAYFGVRPLTTRDGLYTHAIYGFLNIFPDQGFCAGPSDPIFCPRRRC